jgi:hypothetical protein
VPFLGAPTRHSVRVGELVTQAFDYDGGRQVTVFVPSVQYEAIVFAADGQEIAEWGADLEAAD